MPQSAAYHAPEPTALLFGLSSRLVGVDEFHHPASRPEHPLNTPAALETLKHFQQRDIACAWIDELPATASQALTASLPDWIKPSRNNPPSAPWPAPDACWQALISLNVNQLDGCVLVSDQPRLLQAGLNAGLWTIGLASCDSLCGLAPGEWQALGPQERELKRGKTTLQLFSLGAHSVIDNLSDLMTCLADIAQRRLKGEKP